MIEAGQRMAGGGLRNVATGLSMANEGPFVVHRSTVEMLAVDAMVLADEIETYFASDELVAKLHTMSDARQALVARVGLTTMTAVKRIVDWLGSADPHLNFIPEELSASTLPWSAADLDRLTPEARVFAEATRELFIRLDRMRDPERATSFPSSPARALQTQLAERLGVTQP